MGPGPGPGLLPGTRACNGPGPRGPVSASCKDMWSLLCVFVYVYIYIYMCGCLDVRICICDRGTDWNSERRHYFSDLVWKSLFQRRVWKQHIVNTLDIVDVQHILKLATVMFVQAFPTSPISNIQGMHVFQRLGIIVHFYGRCARMLTDSAGSELQSASGCNRIALRLIRRNSTLRRHMFIWIPSPHTNRQK